MSPHSNSTQSSSLKFSERSCKEKVLPPENLVTILEPFMKLPAGNFYYPLKDNYKVYFVMIQKSKQIREEDDFFFRYFGDEKLDEVNNVVEAQKSIMIKNTAVLRNCSRTNAIILEAFKVPTLEMFYEIMKLEHPGIEPKQFTARLEMHYIKYVHKIKSDSML